MSLAGEARGTLGLARRGRGYPVTTDEAARIRKLRYEEGLAVDVIAQALGRGSGTVRRHAPGRVGKVPNDKLRAAFEASGLTATEVARRAGWRYRKGADLFGDGVRVKRTLGVVDDVNGAKQRSVRKWIDAEAAALLAEAIGVAPWEVMPDDDGIHGGLHS
jgi:hypothetical protein